MDLKNKRVLSGIQPSGLLHLGNYFGMIEKMKDFQDNSELFCFVANYHSLTTINDKDSLRDFTDDLFINLISLGIDPNKSTIWIQSDVPEVTELSWILSNFSSVGLMQRSTAYKDKISKGFKPMMGLFSYPILMASDILSFNAEIIPVGEDQKQHIEMTRDIALKFNNAFGEVLTLPEPLIDKNKSLVPGIDNQKMSKSYNNIISIFDKEEIIKEQVYNIVTDSAGLNEKKNINSPLFKIYSLFLNGDEINELKNRYETPGLKYMEVKQELYEIILEYFSEFRKIKTDLLSKPDDIEDLKKIGKNRAQEIAREVLDKVKFATGLI